jgi:methylated-DNA-[protein]-cysteine S-methyltransferase
VTIVETPIGRLGLRVEAGLVTAVTFDAPGDLPLDEGPVGAALRAYFAGDLAALTELRVGQVTGTPFQQAVWAALRAIPPGETVTYGELAARLGRPAAARAIGAACHANPLPVVVPCHRVVGRSGDLVGYAGGLCRKQQLLDLERHAGGQRGGRPASLRL